MKSNEYLVKYLIVYLFHLQEPPPAALEFLVKIREVIAIAKHKMAAKRFQPVLNQIPEEETYPSNGNSLDLYQGLGSQRSGSVLSLKRENSRKRNVSCVGCPGCKSDNGQNFMKFEMTACSNCLHNRGDKQNSIRQWLENIPAVKQQSFFNDETKNIGNSIFSLPADCRNKLRKQNSFTTNSMYMRDIPISKKSSTLSVRSEPPLRSYNFPLPEFEPANCLQNNYSNYCQTISKVDDIRPIGLSDYRPGSLRSNNSKKQRLISNKNALPDMVNEAIALDQSSKTYNHSSSDEEKIYNLTSNLQPIYTRNVSESPSGNEYETDSLERNACQKRLNTPIDYSDVPSSQASPSLSNALPLEEELTMRNAVYKTHSSSNSNTPSPHREINIDQNHYETIGKQNNPEPKPSTPINQNNDYSLVSEVYVNNNYNFGSTPTSPSGSECSMGSRKLIATSLTNTEEKPGCLTIEVKDPPENYIKIHESDGFEPDTLDRKHPKHKLVEYTQFSRKDTIKNIDNEHSPPSQRIQLRSSGTFSKSNNKIEYATKFNSLRNEYEMRKNNYDRPKISPTTFNDTKVIDVNNDACDNDADTELWKTEEGRILTLELRHSKRQRQSTPPTIKQIKNLARPDILPPLPPTEEIPIYEQPATPPRKVEIDRLPVITPPKNVSGRSLSPRTFHKAMTVESIVRNNSIHREPQHGPPCSPVRASGQSMSSEFDNYDLVNTPHRSGDFCRNSNRRPSGRGNINTNTFIKSKEENHSKHRFRRKKGASVEDSGYLSSDSTCSRQVPRKLVIPKIVSCSESDDTENEARSESGAESVETHSVYFGSFRKPQIHVDSFSQCDINNTRKSGRDSTKRLRHSKNCL